MQKIAARDLPLINLFDINYVTLDNKRVSTTRPAPKAPYENFAKVYLAK